MKIYVLVLVFSFLTFSQVYGQEETNLPILNEKSSLISPKANSEDSVDHFLSENNIDTEKGLEELNKEDEVIFRMQEFDTNYLIMGKPDTKVQFSFKFKFLKNAPLYLGYTQIMFWDLLRKESNPFSEINFNPEIFYQFGKINSTIDNLDIGFSHLSNGEDDEESRSVDMLYLRLNTKGESKYGIPNLQLIFRYLFNQDKTNEDINEYYGPFAIRLYFDRIGHKLFQSEQFYLEYYNGGVVVNDYSRSSIRISARFKVFTSAVAPKVFLQYFNGYGENLANYNLREETFRIGFSIGGL